MAGCLHDVFNRFAFLKESPASTIGRCIAAHWVTIICSLTQRDDKNSQSSPGARLSPSKLRGVLLPIITPFRSNGDVDADGFRSDIQKWNRTGIAGYVVLGSTGERVHLNEREYLQVVETARVLGETRGVSAEEIARQTTENFFRLFAKVPRDAATAA